MDRQWTEAISGKKKSSKTAHLRCFRAIVRMTRTGIENLGALFVACRDVQKSTKIRHFRTTHKISFTLFFAKFLHP